MLFVTWACREWSVFDKDLFNPIKEGKGKRAQFVTHESEDGKYFNIVNIVQINGQKFDQELKSWPIQREML